MKPFAIWWRGNKRQIFGLSAFFMFLIVIAGISIGVSIYENRPPNCKICDVHADNKLDIYWLCDRDYSETRMLARQQLGIAYNLKDFGYIESNKDILPVQLDIIRGRIK